MTIQVANVTSAGNTVYTSTGNTAITFLSICNFDTATVAANVHVVPSGQIASNNNMILANLTLTSQDTYQLYAAGEKLLLGNGDFVSIVSSANTVTAVTSFTTI